VPVRGEFEKWKSDDWKLNSRENMRQQGHGVNAIGALSGMKKGKA
jgi:hypothetical protein